MTITDNIGNLYKNKVKDKLLEFLHPKVSKKANKKETSKKIRNDIFAKLVFHNYLKESHNRQASGSESLGTSYSVGDHYQEALDDYYDYLENRSADVKVEIIEKENRNAPDLAQVFDDNPSTIHEGDLKEAIIGEFSDFNFEIFEIYSLINHSEFRKALKLGHGLLARFLSRVYRHFNDDNSAMTTKNLYKFIRDLGIIKNFPFRYEELTDFMNKYKDFNYTDESIKEVKELAEKVYLFQYKFFIKIKSYIKGED